MGHKTWIGDPINGGALLDWGSHGFDILRFVAGADPVRISRGAGRLRRRAGRRAVGHGPAGVCERGHRAALDELRAAVPGLDSPFRLWIVGETGILQVNRFGQTLLGRGDSWTVISEDPAAGLVHRATPRPGACRRSGAADPGLGRFRARDGRPSSAPADAGRWAVMQVEAAYRSWRATGPDRSSLRRARGPEHGH